MKNKAKKIKKMSNLIFSGSKPIFYRHVNDGLEDDPVKQYVNFEIIKNNLEDWNPSTCTINGKVVLNEDKRKSLTYEEKFYVSLPKNLTMILNLFTLSNGDVGEFIKYENTGKFERHKDRKKNGTSKYEHTYNLLIYFPGEYEGGDLIVYNEDGSSETIITNSNEYKYILIDINKYHETTEVTSGVKYLFKLPLYSQLLSNYLEDDRLED